ncbi:MAG: DUF1330 domain-containing protein [Sandarakinorhabdus sp.]|jgi:uncharacterized protein (DUF1330 family)|nr:DUF1330 domain-containing protein [Sandarakinorhabdus sp.]
MTAWLVITARIHDREAFIGGYGPAAARLVDQYGGRYVIRAPGAVLLEGSGMDGASVVVSEWPSRDAALAFWNSPEYAEVKKLREGLADVQVMLVGG